MTLDLRPLALGELFDRAFMLYRRHFWLFVGITAVPGVFALMFALAQQGMQTAAVKATAPFGDSAAGEAAAAQVGVAVVLFAGMMLALVLYLVIYTVALGATTFAVSELYVGRSVTIRGVYGRMRGRLGALMILLLLVGLRLGGIFVAGSLLIGVAAAAGAATGSVLGVVLAVILGIVIFCVFAVMTLRYSVAVPALVLEGLRPGESIRRSIELTKGRLGRVFLLMLCSGMISYAAMILFQGPFLAGALFAGAETTQGFWLSVAGVVTGTIGNAVTAPFLVIGLALLYYDARIREEGFDVELALGALDGVPDAARG